MDFELLKKCVEILSTSDICKSQIERIKNDKNITPEQVDEFCFNKLKEIYFHLKKQLSLPH